MTRPTDKIRALARAGYDRVEIREYLGVEYQQVRQALVSAGITTGLRRPANAERDPLTVEEAPASAQFRSSEYLTSSGFVLHGEWGCGGPDGIELSV